MRVLAITHCKLVERGDNNEGSQDFVYETVSMESDSNRPPPSQALQINAIDNSLSTIQAL